MRITKKVEILADEIVGIQCNKCGNWFEPNYTNTTQSFNTEFGEGSKYETSWDFEMCESCLENLVKTFKVVPSGFMGERSYVPAFITDHDLHQELFEEWKISGEWNYDDNPYKEFYKEDEVQNSEPSDGNTLKRIK